MRRCIGCRQSFPQEELKRFTLQDGVITADTSHHKNEGRGFYICSNPECLAKMQDEKFLRRIKNVKKDK